MIVWFENQVNNVVDKCKRDKITFYVSIVFVNKCLNEFLDEMNWERVKQWNHYHSNCVNRTLSRWRGCQSADMRLSACFMKLSELFDSTVKIIQYIFSVWCLYSIKRLFLSQWIEIIHSCQIRTYIICTVWTMLRVRFCVKNYSFNYLFSKIVHLTSSYKMICLTVTNSLVKRVIISEGRLYAVMTKTIFIRPNWPIKVK